MKVILKKKLQHIEIGGAGEGNRTLVISLEGYKQSVARQMELILLGSEKRYQTELLLTLANMT
jgi:hypothetical protein